jgi:D-3-phosphoglycerate dehydrogenase
MQHKILITSTSFQDTPGEHHKLLEIQKFDVKFLRGPIKEAVIIDYIDLFDAIICGDDEITREVIKKGSEAKLKVISKYGTGLDKIDLKAAIEFKIPVTNCPGINQITVAEHVFALLLSYIKNIIPEHLYVQNKKWVRYIGTELNGKTIGVLGTGCVGKEVIKRALAFGMKVLAFDKNIDESFSKTFNVKYYENVNDILAQSDIISLNLSLNYDTINIIGKSVFSYIKPGVIIVNTARAGLVDNDFILEGLGNGLIGAYLTDVLDEEPMVSNHPFLGNNKIIITPHIGSRTYENVVNQGIMAIENLLIYIK